MSLTLKPLIRDIILANYTVSAGLCRLNQAFAGLRQAATERKYGWPRDSIRHNSEGGIKRGSRARYRQTFLNFGKKKERSRRRQAWTEESSPSEARNTSGTYKLDARNARAVAHVQEVF